MKMRTHLILSACLTVIICGCQTPLPQPANYEGDAMAFRQPMEKPLQGSLFSSDQAVLSDEAIARVLAGKVELPPRTRVAIIKFPDSRIYGRHYWSDEDFVKVQQQHIDALSTALQGTPQIQHVVPLPSLMTPEKASIPILREAAVRVQADLLLVFRTGSDTYWKYRLFAKDKVKSYSTCELVLLDVRTGVVPFTSVVTRERMEEKAPSDLDFAETMRRAEQQAAVEALRASAEELIRSLRNLSTKSG
jgi:hypothetical protein